MSPLLDLEGDGRLVRTIRCDVESRLLADRHYSRRTPGARDFMGNGEVLVLRDPAGLVVFGWIREQFMPGGRRNGEDGPRFVNEGVGCTIFRNEGRRRSSEIVLEAEAIALQRWPDTARFWTYVDPRKVQSRNPGYCFKVAGWQHVSTTTRGLHLLVKER